MAEGDPDIAKVLRGFVKVCAKCGTPWRTRRGRTVKPVHGSGSPRCDCTLLGLTVWHGAKSDGRSDRS
jgi:hypothetical protein